MAYATVNPYTGETLKTFPTASKEEVLEAIDQAYNTF
jgi:succinate-semialdehyde dehydrogenase/glutarate-semialdehyde dehydrogenase